MSEDQTRSEPDVVLATVRRAVSGAAGASEAKPSGDAAPERLLLTPSLRVDEAAKAAAVTPPTPARRARVQTRTLAAERVSLEQRIAELERAVGDGDGWEPDGSEPVDRETPTRFVLDAGPRFGGAERPSDEVEDAVQIDERDLIRRESTAEPKHEAPDLTADPRPTLASTVAAFRPTPKADTVEREMPSEAPSEPATTTWATEPETSEDFDLVDERVVDEEALRDIVAEIVRSELQGELGERITRNVRKLVRREIHRAIMTRDFS